MAPLEHLWALSTATGALGAMLSTRPCGHGSAARAHASGPSEGMAENFLKICACALVQQTTHVGNRCNLWVWPPYYSRLSGVGGGSNLLYGMSAPDAHTIKKPRVNRSIITRIIRVADPLILIVIKGPVVYVQL